MPRPFSCLWLLLPVPLAIACSSSEAGAPKADAGVETGLPDAGVPDAAKPDADSGQVSLEELVRAGTASASQKPRPDFGALVVAQRGERSYVVESRRDVEPGPLGLPWRSRFRLAAYDGASLAWAHSVDPDDVVGDVAVHPSGEVTLALLRHTPAKLAYDLVRLAADGAPLGMTTLAEPVSLPDGDFAPTDPRPLFRMKSPLGDATTAGWVRLLPDGEGLIATFLSYVDVPASDPLANRIALGVAAFDWKNGEQVERWARVVDGPHAAEPAAWAYDELRWREQAVRPFFARDEASGDLLVGRAWTALRCKANVATFAEFTAADCVTGAVGVYENERLPLAVTRFDSAGARLGTRIVAPDEDAVEQVPFALVARDGKLAVAGAVVRALPDGSRRMYEGSFVDYDGYVAVYDADGTRLSHTDFNLGRGDVLAALSWTADGIVAVGSAGWDRWLGGMSISRGADPLIVWRSAGGEASQQRVVALSSGSRHFNLHDLAVSSDAIVGYGFSDAPMTHSADDGKDAARTFGPLSVRLSTP